MKMRRTDRQIEDPQKSDQFLKNVMYADWA